MHVISLGKKQLLLKMKSNNMNCFNCKDKNATWFNMLPLIDTNKGSETPFHSIACKKGWPLFLQHCSFHFHSTHTHTHTRNATKQEAELLGIHPCNLKSEYCIKWNITAYPHRVMTPVLLNVNYSYESRVAWVPQCVHSTHTPQPWLQQGALISVRWNVWVHSGPCSWNFYQSSHDVVSKR